MKLPVRNGGFGEGGVEVRGESGRSLKPLLWRRGKPAEQGRAEDCRGH